MQKCASSDLKRNSLSQCRSLYFQTFLRVSLGQTKPIGPFSSLCAAACKHFPTGRSRNYGLQPRPPAADIALPTYRLPPRRPASSRRHRADSSLLNCPKGRRYRRLCTPRRRPSSAAILRFIHNLFTPSFGRALSAYWPHALVTVQLSVAAASSVPSARARACPI